jgi:general secretion pathway protein A
MYVEYFELTTKPFQITSDPVFLWLGEKHKEALAILRYGIQDNRGFLLLTGEVGTGKTVLVNKLISLLDNQTIVATLSDPDLDGMDFYRLLADSLKMSRSLHSKAEFLIQFREFLHQCYADRKQVLLIVDESQRLKHLQMEEIRVLSNIELQDRKLINIFFVGQPEFNRMLTTPENRALSQRITVRYNIDVLDQQETHDYVNHRLRVAGSKKPIFKITALDEIFLFSGGIPRLINIICDHALLTAFSKNLKQVDAHMIRECAEELRIPIETVRADAATLKTEEAAYAEVKEPNAPRRDALEPRKTQNSGFLGKVWEAMRLPMMPILWKLVFYGGILLLLIALVVAITHHAGDSRHLKGETDKAAKEHMVPLKNQEGRKSDQLPPPGPMAGKQRPVEATNPTEATSSRQPTSPRKSSPLENSATVVGAAAETGFEAQRAAGADESEEDQLGPLPLLKEKIVVRFNFNSNDIKKEAYAALDRIAHYLAAHPEQRIVLKGYTDSSGSDSYNETVSGFRANAVKSYLVAKGMKADQITIRALGGADPIASNDTVAGRGKNRRVEIEFLDK